MGREQAGALVTPSSASSSSTEWDDDRLTDDMFVTPSELITAAADDDAQTQFGTAVESDFGTHVGALVWWVGVVAWCLAVLAALASAFFIILYTFTFGYDKSKAFLVSVLTSFFFGLLLEQPVKILVVAFALAFIFRKSTDIYPAELDVVADHSVRGTTCHSPLSTIHSSPHMIQRTISYPEFFLKISCQNPVHLPEKCAPR